MRVVQIDKISVEFRYHNQASLKRHNKSEEKSCSIVAGNSFEPCWAKNWSNWGRCHSVLVANSDLFEHAAVAPPPLPPPPAPPAPPPPPSVPGLASSITETADSSAFHRSVRTTGK